MISISEISLVTCTVNFVKFRRLVFETCKYTDQQTNKRTATQTNIQTR